MPTLEEFCTVEATMAPRIVGKGPAGMRIDFPFEGTAIGPHWEGGRPISGTDYLTVREDGNMDLDIRGTIGVKRETVGYRAIGVSLANEDGSANPQELVTFQTGNEDLAWLNDAVGVALGRGGEGVLQMTFYIVRT